MLPEYKKKKILISNEAFILSPFDTLTVYRHRLRDFFSFDYQVECFVPAPKRKYGYFSLPILIGDTFVARMDAKADRKEKVFFLVLLFSVSFSSSLLRHVPLGVIWFLSFLFCLSFISCILCDSSHSLLSFSP